MKKENKNEPSLRFPEFSGEWKKIHAGEAFKNSRSKGHAGLPIYSVTLDRGLVKRNELNRHMKSDAADDANLRAQSGEIVYNMMRMWQGAFGLAKEECMVSPAYIVLSPKSSISSEFFNFWFKSAKMFYYFWAYSHGLTSDRLRLYFNDFSKIPLSLPVSQEQQKIAQFLTAVDTKIEQVSKKKSLLEQYKKGVMQKLFSQELRFKDEGGGDYPDWEDNNFGEIAKKIKNSFNPSCSGGDNWRCVELESLGQANGRILKTFESKKLQSIKTKFLSGDVLFGKLRPYLKKYAHVDFDGVCTSEIWVFRANGVYDKFLYFIVQSETFNKYANVQSGSKMPRADWSIVSSSRFLIPPMKEQQKIADFLSAIDQKIDLVAAELVQAQTFKRGLLQQMFV